LALFTPKTIAPALWDWSASQYNALVAGNDPTNVLYAPGNNIFGNWGTGRERHIAEFGE